MRSVLRRSAAIASATPGYCTLTATARSRPLPGSRSNARCTWPIDAAAIGCGSHSTNTFSGGAPSSSVTTPAASSALIGGAFACSSRERLANRLGEAVVEVARHLPDLHQRALHLAEAVGDLLRRPQLAFGIDRDPPLCRGEQLARRRRGVRRPNVEADPRQLQVARGPGRPRDGSIGRISSATSMRRGDGNDDDGGSEDRGGAPPHEARATTASIAATSVAANPGAATTASCPASTLNTAASGRSAASRR